MSYLTDNEPYLKRYPEDGRLEIDNNRAERSIKPLVMSRKNFLFANTPSGAESGAVVFSLIQTAIENGLDPYRYLTYIFQHAPVLFEKTTDWVTPLLPENAPEECRVKAYLQYTRSRTEKSSGFCHTLSKQGYAP